MKNVKPLTDAQKAEVQKAIKMAFEAGKRAAGGAAMAPPDAGVGAPPTPPMPPGAGAGPPPGTAPMAPPTPPGAMRPGMKRGGRAHTFAGGGSVVAAKGGMIGKKGDGCITRGRTKGVMR